MTTGICCYKQHRFIRAISLILSRRRSMSRMIGIVPALNNQLLGCVVMLCSFNHYKKKVVSDCGVFNKKWEEQHFLWKPINLQLAVWHTTKMLLLWKNTSQGCRNPGGWGDIPPNNLTVSPINLSMVFICILSKNLTPVCI